MVDCSQKLRMLRESRHLTQLQVANHILVCVDSTTGLNVADLDDDSVALMAALIEKLKGQGG